VEHLVRLVDDLLDVSRITRGLIKLQKERIDLAVVLTRAVESSRPSLELRRHVLDVRLPDVSLPVQADAVRLAQVFWNLLNNAAKYTPEGGRIGLSVTVEEQAGLGRRAVVRVVDSGVGISQDMLSKVFDLFIQADHTIERSEGGLGIGLTLVRRLAEMHGGSVTCSSRGPGQGSEFTVTLPLAEDHPSTVVGEAQEPSSFRVVTMPGRRILVVDDNRDSAESLATLLRLSGNDVRTVYEGRQAVTVAGSYRPDLVLLDLGLPGLNGFEVAKRLRSMSGLENSVLVAVTGFATEAHRLRAREAGFDHHLVKPVDFDSLQQILMSLPA
jgi:two-component system CheB/CheR fusion protein